MSPEEMMLNLVCLDRGIVQLNDISSIQKQFEALSPSERRKVSRKIRKLAKKFIRNTTGGFENIAQHKKAAAGLCTDSPRSVRHRRRYNKVKILYVRRMFLDMIADEKNRLERSGDT